MTKPQNDEVGVLMTLALMGAFALCMLVYVVSPYWPVITALFK
ncbi:hypothetical protein [Spirosoma migulaei]